MAATRENFRIAVTGDYEDLALQVAEWNSLGLDVQVVSFKEPFRSAQETVNALLGFDAITLMRERTLISRQILEQLPRLKLIVFTGPSNATLDSAAAIERHITVCNAIMAGARPSSPLPSGGGSPAELTLALMLACAWHIPAADARIRSGGWSFQPGIPLRGKTLGIVGYGNIGKPVARYGQALGMNIAAFSRGLTEQAASADGVSKADLPTLLRTSDVVSIHLPLNSSTTGMIGVREIDAMKPGVILVNTARAPIVDQAAMLAALRAHKIAMAGLDVFDQEPLPTGHPLLRLDNVVMTPHIGYVTKGSLTDMYAAVLEVLAAYRQGIIKNRYTPVT